MFSKRDGRETGLKRQRRLESSPSFVGTNSSSNFIYGGNTSYGYAPQQLPFPVVRLRGLPFDCAEVDIFEFFRGLDIVDILFVHKSGRFSGEAFCVLAYPLQVDYAIQKNRQNIGRRYIEVFRSERQEYYLAVAHEVSEGRAESPRRAPPRLRSVVEGKESTEHTGVLRMRGLPFSAQKEDILEFFKDFRLSEDNVFIVVNFDGRAMGEAFVDFGRAEDAKMAMAMDRMMLGRRYVELFPSDRKEMDYAMSKGRRS